MDQKDTEMNEKGVSSSTSGVVVQVREKKGPLRAAIPYMPFPVAVICLFLNTFVPGLDHRSDFTWVGLVDGFLLSFSMKANAISSSSVYRHHSSRQGTFISAFTVLCGARTDLPDRHVCCVFWLNIAAAFIQILTAVVMVGWIMSIFWGMDMVILASKHHTCTFYKRTTSPNADYPKDTPNMQSVAVPLSVDSTATLTTT
ncbi:hypothetical protein NFI96_033619 [Prochilodus magdalenae]|nr:hypothetical protein NFI96_033619 [Prochilodus magdalenae]